MNWTQEMIQMAHPVLDIWCIPFYFVLLHTEILLTHTYDARRT